MTDLDLSADARIAAASDVIVRQFGHESVVWSPRNEEPVALDAVATLIFQMLDGTATLGELIDDIHDVIGIPASLARAQVERVVALLYRGGALEGARPQRPPAWQPNVDYFPAPPST